MSLIRSRQFAKRFIPILIVLFIGAVNFSLPHSSASDNDVNWYSTYKYVYGGQSGMNLGYAKAEINKEKLSTTDAVYVQVKLSKGVNYDNVPNADTISDYVYSDKKVNFTHGDKDYFEAWVSGVPQYFEIKHENKSTVIISDSFTGNLKIDTELIGVSDTNDILWSNSNSLVVAKVGNAEIDVNTNNPPIIAKSDNQEVADIIISESMSGAALNEEIQLKLPDNFSWVKDSWRIDSNRINAEVSVKENDDSLLVVNNFTDTSSLPGELTIEGAMINVHQDADDGDVLVDVTGKDSDSNVNPDQICIAKVVSDEKSIASIVIDNYPESRPQAGLNKADIVYETAVTPEVTRFLALFDLSEDIDKIGPVSSTRKHFVNLAGGYGGVFAHAGGSKESLELIPKAPVVNLDENYGARKYFYRSSDRNMPYNLYIDTESLNEGLQDKGGIPASSSLQLPTGDMTGGENKNKIVVKFSEEYSKETVFKWNQSKQYYERYENNELFLLENDEPLTANNVVVIFAEHEREYVDNLDKWKVQPVIKGSGPAHFHKNNKKWEGKWEKTSIDSSMEFTVNGEKMQFDPGNTSILVVPDTTKPTMKNTEPNEGDSKVNPSKTIEMTFSEKIEKAKEFSNIMIEDEENNVIEADIDIKDKKLTINPDKNLDYSTTYTITLPANAVKDLMGNMQDEEYKFSFTTKSKPSSGSSGSSGGSGGLPPTQNVEENTANINDKINELLEDKNQGKTINIEVDEKATQLINNEILQKLSDKDCNLAINDKYTKVKMNFEPEALHFEDKNMKKDAQVEISTSVPDKDEIKEKMSNESSIKGMYLQAYDINLKIKENEDDDGREIHNLNGKVNVTLDISDVDVDKSNAYKLTVIHQKPNGNWEKIKSDYNQENKTISFTTKSFSIFAVIEKEQNLIKLTIGEKKVTINENPYKLNVEPYVNGEVNRTLVPLRFISEALGAKVNWVKENKSISIKDNGNEINLTVGLNNASVNDANYVMDCEPEIISPGRCMVPLRFISETLGARVDFNKDTKQISITR